MWSFLLNKCRCRSYRGFSHRSAFSRKFSVPPSGITKADLEHLSRFKNGTNPVYQQDEYGGTGLRTPPGEERKTSMFVFFV